MPYGTWLCYEHLLPYKPPPEEMVAECFPNYWMTRTNLFISLLWSLINSNENYKWLKDIYTKLNTNPLNLRLCLNLIGLHFTKLSKFKHVRQEVTDMHFKYQPHIFQSGASGANGWHTWLVSGKRGPGPGFNTASGCKWQTLSWTWLPGRPSLKHGTREKVLAIWRRNPDYITQWVPSCL